MFRKCEGFNTYEETLNTLTSKSEELEAVTGYKVNIHTAWDYNLHELFIKLATNNELTEVEYVTTGGGESKTGTIMAPRIEGSAGNFYINITDHKNKTFNYFLIDSNEMNDKMWQLFKALSSKKQSEE